MFRGIEIDKNKFYHHKSPIFLEMQNYGSKVKPLHIVLPKASAYVKS